MKTLQDIQAARGTEQMTDPTKYNEEVRDAWINIWVRNSARTYAFIEKKFEEADYDINALPKYQGQNRPVLILASGPSLDDVLPHLKDWEGDIWCSTSQLSTLEYYGVEPTHVVYIDADPSQGHLITPKYRKKHDIVMISHPCMPRELLESWGGPMYFFRMKDPGDDFSIKYLKPMYGGLNVEKRRFIGSDVLNAGCVANAMVSLTQYMGYAPIFLCGYDLGYPDGVRRFTNWYRENGKWVSDRPMLPKDRPVFPGNNGVTTDELSCFYKYSFMILWGLGCPPVISCSKGILSELPWADPIKVIEQQGQGFIDLLPPPLEVYRKGQTYLRPRGVFIVRDQFHVETANVASAKRWWQKLRLKYAFWRMDEFTRMIERKGPSLWRRVNMFIVRPGPYVWDKNRWRRLFDDSRFGHWIGRKLTGQEFVRAGGGGGGELKLSPPPGYPQAAAVPGSAPE